MEGLLHFARGPLFVATFTFMIAGLLRHIYLESTQLYSSVRRLSDRRISVGGNLRQLAAWLVPVNRLYRLRPLISLTSFVFHVGLLVVPVFLVSHVALWRGTLGFGWPALSMPAADILTLITIVTGIVLFCVRVFDTGARSLSSPMDYLLIVILVIPFASGYMACHPAVNPLPYNPMMLTHILSAEVVFVLIPTTKLSHCVLFVFDRFSSDVFWRMPIGAGDRVAHELHGEEARV
jgi:nitrate reductase gamma subunit